MCPDRKLQWFVDNEWPLEVVVQIRHVIIRIFNANFKPRTPVPQTVVEDGPLARTNGFGMVCNPCPHSKEPNPNDRSHRTSIAGANGDQFSALQVHLRMTLKLISPVHHSPFCRAQRSSSTGTTSAPSHHVWQQWGLHMCQHPVGISFIINTQVLQ